MSLYEQINNGEIDIIIGTHALISEDVIFNNLGLVITDEQHRFGVKQRSNLKNKGKLIEAGANIIVAGSAIINSQDFNETISKIKETI